MSAIPFQPDLVAASDTGTSDADNLTRFDNSTAATALRFLVGGTTPGALVTLYVDGVPAGSATATEPATPLSLDPGLDLPDGDHAITARQTAPGDTESAASEPLVVAIDTVAPATPARPDLVPASDSGASNADDLTNDTTPTFTVAAGTAYRYQFDDGPVSPPQTADSFTAPRLADGSHVVRAWAVDAAGNQSFSSFVRVTIDTAGPHTGPGGQLFNPTPESTEYDFAVRYTDFSGDLMRRGVDPASIDGQDVRVTDPSGAELPAERVFTHVEESEGRLTATYRFTPPGGTWDYPDNGTYLLFVKPSQVFDLAGNPAESRYLGPLRVDLMAPPRTPILKSQSDTGVSNTDLVTRFDNSAPDRALRFLILGTRYGATVTLFADGVPVGTAFGGNGSTDITTNGSLDLPDGPHLFTARQTAPGQPNVPDSFALEVTIDTVAPPVPAAPDLQAASDGGVSDADDLTNDNTPTLDVSVAPGAFARVARDGTPLVPDYAPTGAFTAPPIPDGVHDLAVMAVDAAGNASSPSPPLRVAIDTVAPAAGGAPDLAAASDSGTSSTDDLTNDATPTFDVAASSPEPKVYLRFYRDGARISGDYEPVGAFTAPPQPDGTWNYTAGLVDAAGNVSAAGTPLTVRIDTVGPRVSGVYLSGATWSPNFTAALQTMGLGGLDGFALPVPGPVTAPPGAAPLPWTTLDRVTIRSDEPIVVRQQDLRLRGAGGEYATAGFSGTGNPASGNLTWTLPRVLAADRLLLTLADTVTDGAGNRLRGTGAAAASPFQAHVNILPGDADRDGAVTAADLARVRAATRAYNPFANINGDGLLDATDYVATRARLSTALPPPPATAASAQPTRPAHLARRSALLGDSTAPALLPV